MITNSINRNVFKEDSLNLTMSKKEVSISLDESVLSVVDSICDENFSAKRSTVINKLLKEHPKIKKRLNKK